MDQQMVSMFMEITSCESQAYAVQHLGSCRWNLEEAINLYFTGGGSSGVSAPISSAEEAVMKEDDEDYGIGVGGDDGVRAPIPARVETLYGDDAYYGYRTSTAAYDAPFSGEATYTPSPPVPAVPVQALGDGIQATGWEENDVGGRQVHDDAEQEENTNGENNNGKGEDNEEDYEQSDDNMSYSYSDDEMDDYGLEVDEDSYYASIEDEDNTDAPTMQRQHQNSLAELYQPPLDLMYNGWFHDAKVHAAKQDKFLLVNLQIDGDFQSMLHNRDRWSDEMVKEVVKESFVLLLLQKGNGNSHNDDKRIECSKVCSFYRLEGEHQLPAVLVLDPITGQLLAKWIGPMMPDEFAKYVDAYTKSKPSTMLSVPRFFKKTSASAIEPAPASAAAAVGQEPAAPEISALAAEAGEKAPEIPDSSAPAGASSSEQEPAVPAPEDEMVDDDDVPMEGEKMYKLRVRFPDGTMVAKEFGCKRRVASLFAFCRSTVHGGGEAAQKAFRLMRFAGGAVQAVKGDAGVTFEDLGLNCTTVSVVFDM